MRPKICWQDLYGYDFPITLMQKGKNDFTVIYGKEVHPNLSYGEAAKHLGLAIMHAQTCKGKLDIR